MRRQGKPTRRREYIITTACLTLVIAFNVRWENYNTVTCLMHLRKGITYALTDIFIAMFLDAKKSTEHRYAVLLRHPCFSFLHVFSAFLFCYLYFAYC